MSQANVPGRGDSRPIRAAERRTWEDHIAVRAPRAYRRLVALLWRVFTRLPAGHPIRRTGTERTIGGRLPSGRKRPPGLRPQTDDHLSHERDRVGKWGRHHQDLVAVGYTRDGLIARVENYTDRERALKTLGLSAQDADADS
jgi:hypothetical protein